MKIAVSSYCFSQHIKAGKMTQFDCVAKAHEMGFKAIEFTTLTPDRNLPASEQIFEDQVELAKKIRAEADKYGMVINAYAVGSHMSYETDEEDDAEFERLKKELQIAHILGAKVMRHDAIQNRPMRRRSFDLSLPYIANNFRRVAEYAQTLGIKTCFENHGRVCQDPDRCEKLYNAIDHDNFGLLVDFGNFLGIDVNPLTAVSRLAPYAIHAHAKDRVIIDGSKTKPEGATVTRGGNFQYHTAIGDGHVPTKQCIRALKTAGYEGYISMEYDPGREDCISAIARGFENLKKYIAEIENE